MTETEIAARVAAARPNTGEFLIDMCTSVVLEHRALWEATLGEPPRTDPVSDVLRLIRAVEENGFDTPFPHLADRQAPWLS